MIEMREAQLEAIRRHGREAYPEECCGALLGKIAAHGVRVRRLERLVNERGQSRKRRFRISPEQYQTVERRADREGLALLGFYHSHPDHRAIPSAYDREHALPFFHYVVLAVSKGEPGEVSCWVLSEDRGDFQSETLISHSDRR